MREDIPGAGHAQAQGYAIVDELRVAALLQTYSTFDPREAVGLTRPSGRFEAL